MAGRKRRPCGMCPHYGDSRKPQAWCSILAKWTTATSPSCDWGKAQMSNAHAREYMRKRHGYVKRYKVEARQNDNP